MSTSEPNVSDIIFVVRKMMEDVQHARESELKSIRAMRETLDELQRRVDAAPSASAMKRVEPVMREWTRWAWLSGFLDRVKKRPADEAASRRRDRGEDGGGLG
jgi:hypothetical protein